MRALPSLFIFVFLINASLSLGFILGTLQLFELLRAIIFLDFLILPLLLIGFGYYFFQKKTFPKINNYILLASATLLLGIFVYSTALEPYQLKVRYVKIRSPKLKQSLKIVHISDIQTYLVGNYERRAFQKIKSLNPDLIIHTGNLVQNPNVSEQNKSLGRLATYFARLEPKYGIYSVIASSDFFTANVPLLDSLAHTQTLIDEFRSVADLPISILGLSPQNARYGYPQLIDAWQRQSDSNTLKILIGHNPNFIASVDSQKVDICLAGATQGGQIRLPGIGPVIRNHSIPLEWYRGSFQYKGVACHVSAGLGTPRKADLPPIRFNCPPEITVIELNEGR